MNPSNFNDLTGQRFARLKVISRAENYKNGASRFLCVCECGSERVIGAGNLVCGKSKSCGCARPRTLTPEHRAAMRGWHHTPESRAKIRAAQLGKPLSPGHRAAISAGHRRSKARKGAATHV
jgi:hypothetical protein